MLPTSRRAWQADELRDHRRAADADTAGWTPDDDEPCPICRGDDFDQDGNCNACGWWPGSDACIARTWAR